ncbi:MAG: hypothetical protein M3O33_00010 [Cyanobacteriota bacterium]|nr:hypothetical protein [Cyanobacteriota bacterium]
MNRWGDMKRLRRFSAASSIAIIFMLACSTVAHAARPSSDEMEMTPKEAKAWQYLHIGKQATEKSDWDSAIINFRRATSTFEDACFSPYARYLLEAAEKAKLMKAQGSPLRDVNVTYLETLRAYPCGCS